MNSILTNFSSHLQNAHLAAQLLDTLLKSFVVLALAGGVCALWRRAAAATRHLIWFLAVASLPFLPLLNSIPTGQRPLWAISSSSVSGNQISLALELAPKTITQNAMDAPVATENFSANQTSTGGRKIATYFSVNWLALGFAAWLGGAALALISVAAGQFRLRQFSRNAQPVRDANWTRLVAEARETLRLHRTLTLLQSADDVMPLTWGWRSPLVLLPAEAARWPEERRRIVLLHELAHVKRADYLTQLVVNAVCAIYWFNPLVWLAARQMRVERELACDDLVLASGCKASDYAGHLVDIAQSFRRVPLATAIAMARSSQLAGRVAAIVDGSRNRRMRSASAIAILALIGGVAVCIGSSGTISGGVDKAESLRQQQIARLKIFSAEKEKQSQLLAAAAGETISPEYQKFFRAATSGDWQMVTNMFESFKQRHPQYSHLNGHPDLSLRTAFWQPVLETCLAYANVVECEPAYTQLATDGIINSIPAGSIYFGGTDPGRGLPTAFCKSQINGDPFYTLTQNALADGTYLDYLRRTYGEDKRLLTQFADACQADSALQALNARWLAAVQQLGSATNDLQRNIADGDASVLWQQRNDRVNALLASVRADTDKQKSAPVHHSNGISDNGLQERIAQLKSEVAATQLEIADAQKDSDSERRAASASDLERRANVQQENLRFYETMQAQAHLDESSHPSGSLYIPTGEDSQRCFQDYSQDAVKRLHNNQLKLGENVKEDNGRLQISGQTAVMEINGLLVKTILDKNPGHEFYMEESFPLDWMYPNLEPHGLIFKLNRQPLAALSDEAVRQDREYWQPRVNQMIGGWLNDDTSVKDVTAFGEKVFLRHDLGGFSGDARYVQNDWATKMFAKMRVAIAGLYAWRAEHADSSAEKERMTRAADFAFRQAVALGPNSPEATHRYAEFLKAQHREADAKLMTELAEKFKAKTDGAVAPAKAPIFQMRLALDAPSDDSELMTNVSQIGLTGNRHTAEVLNLQKTVLLDETALKSAKLVKNQQGLPQINIRFTEAGRKQFAEVTRQHLHQRLAIVIDGKLVEAPVIQSEIPSGEAIITGSFSEAEAKALTAKINAAIAQ